MVIRSLLNCSIELPNLIVPQQRIDLAKRFAGRGGGAMLFADGDDHEVRLLRDHLRQLLAVGGKWDGLAKVEAERDA